MTPEERREYNRRWREAHPDYYRNYIAKNRKAWNERYRKYQREHSEAQRKRMNEYHQTKAGRATNLLSAYIQMDLERLGVRPFLNQEDIIRKCFEPGCKCVYCGETDWHKLGLDRIDNDKPHDRWNTVCSCHACNDERRRKDIKTYVGSKGMTWQEFMEKTELSASDYIEIFE